MSEYEYEYEPYKYDIKRWTYSAMECYKRGCVCEGCFINEYFCKRSNEVCSDKGITTPVVKKGGWTCQMKAAVLASVSKFGIPAHLNRCKNELILED